MNTVDDFLASVGKRKTLREVQAFISDNAPDVAQIIKKSAIKTGKKSTTTKNFFTHHEIDVPETIIRKVSSYL